MDNAELMTIINQISELSHASDNQLQYSDMRALFEGKEMTGRQIDLLWKQLDQRRIMVFHIDEEDVLFAGVAMDKTVTISGAEEVTAKRGRRGFFRRH